MKCPKCNGFMSPLKSIPAASICRRCGIRKVTGDYLTGIGYWYHNCPTTDSEHRIGFNYNIVKKNGKCPPYEKCYRCGTKRPKERK